MTGLEMNKAGVNNNNNLNDSSNNNNNYNSKIGNKIRNNNKNRTDETNKKLEIIQIKQDCMANTSSKNETTSYVS